MNVRLMIALMGLSFLMLVGCMPQDQCAQIQTGPEQDDCFLVKATQSSNKEMCGHIENKGIKHECLTNISISLFDSKGCETGLFNPEFCLHEIAVATNDIELCNKINLFIWKNQCFNNIAQKYGNYQLCNKINNDDDKDNCLLDGAINTNDSRVCDEIKVQKICDLMTKICTEENVIKDKCYKKLSYTLNDLELCAKIKDITQKDLCINKYAITNNQKDLCNKLSIKDIKAGCIKNFEK